MTQPDAMIRLVRSGGDKAVPADVLVRTVEGMQRLIYLLAADADDRTLDKRFRPSEEIQSKFKLMCLVPEAGSYQLPVALTTEGMLFNLDSGSIFSKLDILFECIAQDNLEALKGAFADSAFKKRALKECSNFLPKAGEQWQIGFKNLRAKYHTEKLIGSEHHKQINKWLEQFTQAESVMTITGELIAIEFDVNKVTIKYPVNKQSIECFYDPEIENEMIESRRGFVQVTGTFTLGNDGNPVKLVNCTRIEPVDLSPIELNKVNYDGHSYRFREALTLPVQLDDETNQLYCVCENSFGLTAYASTRDQLVEEIGSQIHFLWQEYAQCDAEILTPEAKMLQRGLLKVLEPDNAA